MNRITGNIINIQVDGRLSLVKVQAKSSVFTTIIIDTPETVEYLKINHSIQLLFKETEVILARGTDISISLQNRLIGKVSVLETGKLLSKVQLNTEFGAISAIITTNAVQQLALKVGATVVAMIKTNEIMLSE